MSLLKNKIAFLILFLVLLSTTIGNFFSLMTLNRSSLRLIDHINDANSNKLNISLGNSCHSKWISALSDQYLKVETDSPKKFIELLSCSNLHFKLIQLMFPKNKAIATAANMLFPENPSNLYWLMDSVEDDFVYSKEIANQLLKINGQDSVAWRRLGEIQWREANYQEAISSYLKACIIDDGASNGCYYVAASYRTLGEIDKAIYYFRLSKWPPSQLEADLLESKNP